jgi:hypothetical protein
VYFTFGVDLLTYREFTAEDTKLFKFFSALFAVKQESVPQIEAHPFFLTTSPGTLYYSYVIPYFLPQKKADSFAGLSSESG